MARWLGNEDVNSSIFHVYVNNRPRSNSILAFSVRDEWVEKVNEVRHKVVRISLISS